MKPALSGSGSNTDAGGVTGEFIAEAVASSHVNALRLALYQATKDRELIGMTLVKKKYGQGVGFEYSLSAADAVLVRQKAATFLTASAGAAWPEPPTRDEVKRLIGIFHPEAISETKLELAADELAFAEFPREVRWSKKPSEENLAEKLVVVIGGGISGIAAAVQLKRLGIPFIGIDRQGGFGGTWFLNTYPEARVDTASYSYQYTFEKDYVWSEHFASQRENQDYLAGIARKHGIDECYRFENEVIEGAWDDARARWTLNIRGPDGGVYALHTHYVISAVGTFTNPVLPDIPGIETFAGDIFHTAFWNHGCSLGGKRIALIGTGSTGTQVAPHLAREASQLSVFQRTPSWIYAKAQYREPTSPQMKWMFKNMPFYWNWYCFSMFFNSFQLRPMVTRDENWQAQGGVVSEANDILRKNLTEYIVSKIGHRPDLLEKLTPTYPPLVKRLVVDNGFYDTLLKPNVELVTTGIETIQPRGIRTVDGTERQFDVIVLGAGFQVSKFLSPVKYLGRGGVAIDDIWGADGARAYLGVTVPGFPNFFMFSGPNGAVLGGRGMHSLAEVTARYVLNIIVQSLEKEGEPVEVKSSVYEDYNRLIDSAGEELIWNGTDGNYYMNEYERQCVILPLDPEIWFKKMAQADIADFGFIENP